MSHHDRQSVNSSSVEEVLGTLANNVQFSKDHESKPSTPNEEESELHDKSATFLAAGISSLLGTIIKDFNCKLESTAKSQDRLSSSLDRLTRELDQLLEDAPLPFIVQHAAKISGVRKRVSSLNSLLKTIQARIDNVDLMLTANLTKEKAILPK